MWLVYFLAVSGIIFFLVTRQRNARRGVAGGGFRFSLPRLSLAVDRKLVTAIVVVLVGLLVIYFFPDTVPGKALLKATGFSEQSEWYPWVMWYLPTALLVWIGWRMIFASPTAPGATNSGGGIGGFIKSLLWLGVLVAVLVFVAYQINQWNKDRSSGDMSATVSLNGPGSPQRATINRKGTITVAFRVPVNQPGWLICQRLVEPTVLRSHGGLPRYVLKDVFKGGGVVTYVLNDQTMAFVMKEDVTSQLTFEFELRQATPADPSPCPR